MSVLIALAAVAGGLLLLVFASDRFVTGAAGTALRLRLPSVVVGAVIVGFGTSAPELLVSTLAAAGGSRDIAIGNVTGSNLANMTLVLGIVALIAAPTVTSRTLRREVPLTVAAMLLLTVVLQPLSRSDGIVLLVGFVAAMVVVLSAGESAETDELGVEVDEELHDAAQLGWFRLTVLTLGGLVGTVLGAQLLVSGALSIAEELALAEGLVGFTLVAIGTSLPEVVTCVHAARRNEAELAIGNVLGSNLFNSLPIVAAAALISPGRIDTGLVHASWVMVATGLVMWWMMSSGRRLARWEGVVLIAAYGATVPLVG